ncbi:hypothetical protein [Pelosinus fermentans]|uniref:Uncharacterized protein n=1 Tax=Pelosinus fermentans JBW45 TaxID=1192197 RepID=I8TUM5_9FIRM|nr:hypothetical protein [Pelosinus fermentans]AJQ26919.1 hypothetical protein JBW_01569 [Pelosinus fermentans JBW45]
MEDIAEYTKDQLVLFYSEATKLEAARRADFIYDVRAAVWADGKEFEKIAKVLVSIAKEES